MSAKYFLDTSVFVYTFVKKDFAKKQRARELVRDAARYEE